MQSFKGHWGRCRSVSDYIVILHTPDAETSLVTSGRKARTRPCYRKNTPTQNTLGKFSVGQICSRLHGITLLERQLAFLTELIDRSRCGPKNEGRPQGNGRQESHRKVWSTGNGFCPLGPRARSKVKETIISSISPAVLPSLARMQRRRVRLDLDSRVVQCLCSGGREKQLEASRTLQNDMVEGKQEGSNQIKRTKGQAYRLKTQGG